MAYTIYTIRHIETDRVVYVGKTNNFERRVYQHLSLNSNAKEWLAEIGTDNVLIEPVAEFDNETDALKYEDALILKYDTVANGYNKYRSGLIEAENPKEYRRWYRQTDKYRECRREFEKTDKRKDYKRWYRQTDKYREYKREQQREYRKTDKYRAYNRDRYHAKKIGMSVAEYREKNQKTVES